MKLTDVIGRDLEADILDTVNQMYKKKLLPERSRKLIYDNIKQMASQYMITVFKEWSCSKCPGGITVKGPKLLMIQHAKIHTDGKLKENEIIKTDFKIY